MNEAIKTYHQAAAALNEFGATAIYLLLPRLVEVSRSLHLIRDLVWLKYRQAGMPYGESEDGMLRWFEEQSIKR